MKGYKYLDSFDQIHSNFKCQSCFWYFDNPDSTYTIDEDDKYETKWFDVQFTQELYDHIIGLIHGDAYEIEFRIKK